MHKSLTRTVVFFFALAVATDLAAQEDIVYFEGGNVIIGEVKGLENSVLTVKTAFTDSDMKLEWMKVHKIITSNTFTVVLSNGERQVGIFNTDYQDQDVIQITSPDGSQLSVPQREIVRLRPYDSRVWNRFTVLIDGGYSLTKANDAQQFTLKSNVHYFGEVFNFSGSTNVIDGTTQDSIRTNRQNYSASAKYFFKVSRRKKMFLFLTGDWLRSDEQDLDLRTTLIFGPGINVIRNQVLSLELSTGLVLNEERFYSDSDASSESGESYVKVECIIYGMDNLTLSSKGEFFPSFTKNNRYRLNYDINLKYDLPLDFYVRIGYQANFDNQPQTGAEKSDFVFSTSLGWEFK